MLKIKWINTSNMLRICLAHSKCSMTICYCYFIFIVIRSRYRTIHMSFYWILMTVLSGRYFFFFFLLHQMACRILVPWPGTEPVPLHWKLGVLATGPPGKSLYIYFHSVYSLSHCRHIPSSTFLGVCYSSLHSIFS